MSFPAHTPPEINPRKIFFRLENDILSIAEYIALIVKLSQFEMDDDERLGVHRLAMEVQDHANAIRDGFREAFKADEGRS
jgi:hypothetical protein